MMEHTCLGIIIPLCLRFVKHVCFIGLKFKEKTKLNNIPFHVKKIFLN